MSIDTWLGVFGAITGIVGLITGYIFYPKGVNPKEPCWNVENTLLIQDYTAQVEDLRVLY